MRILFVCARFPYPAFYGDQVRGLNQIRELSRRHSVVLLAPEPEGDRDEALSALGQYCDRIELVPAPRWRRFVRLAQAPFTRLPLQTLMFFDAAFAVRARKLTGEERFDLVHVQLVRMAPIVGALPSEVPRVLDLIDALSVNMAQRARREHGAKALAARIEARRIADYERLLTAQYHCLISSSQQDRAAIGEYDNVHVVANGVAYPAAGASGTAERDPDLIVFSGTMWYFPNVDASEWFVGKVLPLVRKEIPGAKLSIVGARPAPQVQRLASASGVEVTGFVPSVQKYLARATVAVAPMRSGSGMQFKVIEAMAMGTPVVATPFGLGGLDATSGEHLLVAEDAAGFAREVVRLLRDDELRYRLTQNAARLVEERYTWERTVERLEAVYDSAVVSHGIDCAATAAASTGAKR